MGVIALTGGVAAGKSTVSAILREQGAIVLDADVFARKAVAPGSAGLHAIAEAFGTGIILPSGELDRTALSALVFRDDNARATLIRLFTLKLGAYLTGPFPKPVRSTQTRCWFMTSLCWPKRETLESLI